MKHLILIRHAKSSWSSPNMPDYKRPLNERGKRDAPLMASMLAEKLKSVDAIVTSHAVRAHTTAKSFAAAFGMPENSINVKPRLYHCEEDEILTFVREMPDSRKRVLLFGHNPGFTEFANLFSPPYIDNVPTCGIVHLRSSAESWQQFDTKNTELVNFYYPKQDIK